VKELRKILQRIRELHSSGEECVLATVVNVRGSAYRRPGARMLFSQRGREVGFISAVCLESDLFKKAKEVLSSKRPTLVSYDTTAPEDVIFGVGQGCGGFVEILIEPFTSEQDYELAVLQSASQWKEPCGLATVIKINTGSNERIGSKILWSSSGETSSTVIDTELIKHITDDLQKVLKTGKSFVKQYESSEGSTHVFLEIIRPPVSFIIFGSGPDVKPLVRLTSQLGWTTTVVDHRSAYTTTHEFPEADEVRLLTPDQYAQNLLLTPDSFAVIMIHQFETEVKALQFLFQSPVRYIGLLGPKSKRDLLLEHLGSGGFVPTDEQLGKLYNPVGLDIGAETAEEVALSIAAEIQSIAKGRKSGFLKDRKGSIHS
jgi:xanthine dehydrogenase accessory factor